MIIGFDAKRAFFNRTGLGNYSRGVLGNLSRYFPEHVYRLYSPHPATGHFPEAFTTPCLHAVFPKRSWGAAHPLWRSLVMGKVARQDGVHIFHGLSHELPMRGLGPDVAKVVTVHDLIPFRHPEHYPLLDRFVYRTKMRHSCRTADLIVAISTQTRDDIHRFLGVPVSKVRVVYQSCAQIFREPASKKVHHNLSVPYNLPDRYLLSVGSITERKNLLTVAKAMATLRGQDMLPLVVVGQGGDYLEKIRDFVTSHGLEHKFLFLGHVDLEDLASIYSGATAFLYPSLFEGFGIPIIEALSCGIPVVTSQGSCFAETAGGGGLYVDPLDVEQLAEAIQRISTKPSLRADLSAAGLKHVQRFHPEKVTTDLIGAYHVVSASTRGSK